MRKDKNKLPLKLSGNLKAGLKAVSVFLFLMFPALSLRSQPKKGIYFEKGSLAAIFSKAGKENKMVFIDCYTSWCGPCKWMAKEVFTNDTVAGFYNTNFICAKFNMEEGEGLVIARTYSVNSYPAFLYLDAAGVLQHKVCGSDVAKGFIKTGEDALTPENRLSACARQYKNNPNDRAITERYLQMLEAACQPATAIGLKILSFQKESELISRKNWDLIYKYSDYSSKSFKYLVANKNIFSGLFGVDSVEEKINRIYEPELLKASRQKNVKRFETLKAEFKQCKTKQYKWIIDHSEIHVVKLGNDEVTTATEIHDSIIGPANVSVNHNAWYWFRIDHDTTLFFDIVPNDSLDDYDFSVYLCNDKNNINHIKQARVKPIRSCYSYCTSKSGITGLSQYATQTDIGVGPGPAYVSAVKVNAGDNFYLQVHSQFLSVKGYKIYFYNYWSKKKPVILNNIFFESNNATLLKESFPELDKLVSALKANQMKIEIRGHTDSQGNEKNNQLLSEERAKAVYSYLISKKISPERLFYKGFGNKQPITTNDTEDGRKKNRRVEFVVIMY